METWKRALAIVHRQPKQMIVNADDFGQSHAINRGIIEAFECGIVTSASLMVRWPAARDAAHFGRRHPELSLGMHVDLGEWIYRDEDWVALYEVVAADDAAAVEREVSRQLTTFVALAGRTPTHLDSHQHVHRSEPMRSLLLKIAHRLQVPLRHYTPAVTYCGDFYGQDGKGSPYPEGISVDRLVAVIERLAPGLTELGCHPGRGVAQTMAYNSERTQEVATLCDPRVRQALADAAIQLCSFHDVLDRRAAT